MSDDSDPPAGFDEVLTLTYRRDARRLRRLRARVLSVLAVAIAATTGPALASPRLQHIEVSPRVGTSTTTFRIHYIADAPEGNTGDDLNIDGPAHTGCKGSIIGISLMRGDGRRGPLNVYVGRYANPSAPNRGIPSTPRSRWCLGTYTGTIFNESTNMVVGRFTFTVVKPKPVKRASPAYRVAGAARLLIGDPVGCRRPHCRSPMVAPRSRPRPKHFSRRVTQGRVKAAIAVHPRPTGSRSRRRPLAASSSSSRPRVNNPAGIRFTCEPTAVRGGAPTY
ncbi:MAG: hypothetical protein M3071_06350 [Actinomycetota bacterium]|nr:hypothetical protein [Actinomycetota bacterium]